MLPKMMGCLPVLSPCSASPSSSWLSRCYFSLSLESRLPLCFSLTSLSSPGHSKQGQEGSRACFREWAPSIPPALFHRIYCGDRLLGTPQPCFTVSSQPCLPWLAPYPSCFLAVTIVGPQRVALGRIHLLPSQVKHPSVGRLKRAAGQIDVRAHFGLTGPSPCKHCGAQGLHLLYLLPQLSAAKSGVPTALVDLRHPHLNSPSWPGFAFWGFLLILNSKLTTNTFSQPSLCPIRSHGARLSIPAASPGLSPASAPTLPDLHPGALHVLYLPSPFPCR